MHAQAIFNDLRACGIAPRVTADGRGIVLPAGQLNPAQRVAITAHKTALIEFLRSIDQVQKAPPARPAPDPGAAALLALALAYCTHTSASDKARQDWHQDVADTPPELRGDLYLYLREQLQEQRRPAPAPAPARPAPPAPAPAPGWLHMSQSWRVADRAYEAHHWQCHTCRAAAGGHTERCAHGLQLYATYDKAVLAAMHGSTT